jgi:ribosome-binding factor A
MPKHRDNPLGPSQRQLRVAEEIRHALAAVIERGDFREPELAGARITVTEVRASPDLKHMTAFVSGLGRNVPPEQFEALKRSAPWLRGQISRMVRLKHSPQLHFQPDTALDYAMKIDTLMRRPEIARDLGSNDGITRDLAADPSPPEPKDDADA